jgi:hypothetical protein
MFDFLPASIRSAIHRVIVRVHRLAIPAELFGGNHRSANCHILFRNRLSLRFKDVLLQSVPRQPTDATPFFCRGRERGCYALFINFERWLQRLGVFLGVGRAQQAPDHLAQLADIAVLNDPLDLQQGRRDAC